MKGVAILGHLLSMTETWRTLGKVSSCISVVMADVDDDGDAGVRG